MSVCQIRKVILQLAIILMIFAFAMFATQGAGVYSAYAAFLVAIITSVLVGTGSWQHPISVLRSRHRPCRVQQSSLVVALLMAAATGSLAALASLIILGEYQPSPGVRNPFLAETDSVSVDLLESVACNDKVQPAPVSTMGTGANRRRVLYQHPSSACSRPIWVGSTAKLLASLRMSEETWFLGKGDGVQFNIFIEDGQRKWHPFSEYIDPKNIPEHRKWHDREIDLSQWAGQTVTITLATGPGPNGDDRYDWAGWGEPRIVQPIAYDFLAELPNADRGGATAEQVRRDTITIDHEQRPVLFQHPISQVTYRLEMPQGAGLHFGLGLDPAVWSPDKGDGVEYNLYVRYPYEPHVLHRVYHRYLDPKNVAKDRHWLDQVVDLSPYGGQTIDLIFETLPGPAGDTCFDWGGWSTPVLVADDMAVLNPAPPLTGSSIDHQP